MIQVMCPHCKDFFEIDENNLGGMREKFDVVVGYIIGDEYCEDIIQTVDYCPDLCSNTLLKDSMRDFIKNLGNIGFVINAEGDLSIRNDTIVKVYYKKH